jgi:hypothetical protein
MGALYKGFIATASCLLVAGLRPSSGAGFGVTRSPRPASVLHRPDLFLCGVLGLVVTGLIIWVTEYYTGTKYRPVKLDQPGVGHRSRHQRDPGSCRFAGSDRAAGPDHHRGIIDLSTSQACSALPSR